MKLKLVKLDLYLFCLSVLSVLYLIQHLYVISIYPNVLNAINVLNWFFLIIVAINLFTSSYKKKELFIISIIGIFLVISYFYNGYTTLLQAFILIVGAKDEDIRDILIVLIYSYSAIVILAIILYFLGISNSGKSMMDAITLGFTTKNICAGIIQTIWFLFISRYGIEALRSFRGNMFILVMVICLILIKSRASIALMLISILLIPLMKKMLNSRHKRVIKLILYGIVPILTLLTYVTAKYYTQVSIFQRLDVLFSSRVFLNYYNLRKFGVSLFGHTYSYAGETLYNIVTHTYSTYNTLDNSYICLIIEYGIMDTILWIIGYTLLVKRCIKENYYGLLVSAILVALYGFTESSVLYIFISFPLLYIYAKTDYSKKPIRN